MSHSKVKLEEWVASKMWVVRVYGVRFGLSEGERASGVFGQFEVNGGVTYWTSCATEECTPQTAYSEFLDDVQAMIKAGRYAPRRKGGVR